MTGTRLRSSPSRKEEHRESTNRRTSCSHDLTAAQVQGCKMSARSPRDFDDIHYSGVPQKAKRGQSVELSVWDRAA